MKKSPESEHYDNLYSEQEVTFGGGKPEGVVEAIMHYRNSGSVLELGAGEGRNALFLASKNFEVTAKDISSVGIEKIKRAAQEKGLELQANVADVRTLDFEKNFDIMVSTYLLHHLSREEALALIDEMRKHTSADGLNAITAFTKNGDFFRMHPETDMFYPDENELKELYADWELLEYEEKETKAYRKKEDGSHMMNVSAKILAKKLGKS